MQALHALGDVVLVPGIVVLKCRDDGGNLVMPFASWADLTEIRDVSLRRVVVARGQLGRNLLDPSARARWSSQGSQQCKSDQACQQMTPPEPALYSRPAKVT